MVDARYTCLELRHTIRYPKTQLPPSYFVISSKQSGHVIYNIPRPLLWVRSYQNGRLFVDVPTLSHLEDSRVHRFDHFTFSERNIWKRVFPPSCRETLFISCPPELSEHLESFVKTKNNFVKPKNCMMTGKELEPQRFGDQKDITLFCIPFPRSQLTGNSSNEYDRSNTDYIVPDNGR